MKNRIHYAWLICLGCFIINFCANGIIFQIFSVFQPFMLEQYHISNTEISGIITAKSICSLIAVWSCGIYYRRMSFRKGMLIAGLISTVGMFIFTFAESYDLLLFAAALNGLGNGFGTTAPMTMVIGRWFKKKRSLAIALASIASSTALLGFPTVVTKLIINVNIHFAFGAVAMFSLLLAVLSYIIIRDEPKELGLLPYGADEGDAKAAETPKKRLRRDGLRKSDWILLITAGLIVGVISNTGFLHLSLMYSTAGCDPESVALALSMYGGCLVFGKLSYGWMADRIGSFKANWIYCSLLSAGMFIICFVGKNKSVLFPGTAILGVGMAVCVVGLMTWAGDLSSTEQYDKTVRICQGLFAAGGIIFNMLPGMIADRYGSYIPAYIGMAVLALIMFFSIQYLYIRKNKDI